MSRLAILRAVLASHTGDDDPQVRPAAESSFSLVHRTFTIGHAELLADDIARMLGAGNHEGVHASISRLLRLKTAKNQLSAAVVELIRRHLEEARCHHHVRRTSTTAYAWLQAALQSTTPVFGERLLLDEFVDAIVFDVFDDEPIEHRILEIPPPVAAALVATRIARQAHAALVPPRVVPRRLQAIYEDAFVQRVIPYLPEIDLPVLPSAEDDLVAWVYACAAECVAAQIYAAAQGLVEIDVRRARGFFAKHRWREAEVKRACDRGDETVIAAVIAEIARHPLVTTEARAPRAVPELLLRNHYQRRAPDSDDFDLFSPHFLDAFDDPERDPAADAARARERAASLASCVREQFDAAFSVNPIASEPAASGTRLCVRRALAGEATGRAIPCFHAPPIPDPRDATIVVAIDASASVCDTLDEELTVLATLDELADRCAAAIEIRWLAFAGSHAWVERGDTGFLAIASAPRGDGPLANQINPAGTVPAPAVAEAVRAVVGCEHRAIVLVLTDGEIESTDQPGDADIEVIVVGGRAIPGWPRWVEGTSAADLIAGLIDELALTRR